MRYIKFLFDSKEAWEQTISDPHYYYEMPLDEFMAIYKVYRAGKKPVPKKVQAPIAQMPKEKTTAIILDQSEVDKLIEEMVSTKPKKEEIKHEPLVDGLLSQDDIDSLFASMK